MNDLTPVQLQQLIEFFKQYNRLDGKEFRPIETFGEKAAEKLVRKGMKKKEEAKAQLTKTHFSCAITVVCDHTWLESAPNLRRALLITCTGDFRSGIQSKRKIG